MQIPGQNSAQINSKINDGDFKTFALVKATVPSGVGLSLTPTGFDKSFELDLNSGGFNKILPGEYQLGYGTSNYHVFFTNPNSSITMRHGGTFNISIEPSIFYVIVVNSKETTLTIGTNNKRYEFHPGDGVYDKYSVAKKAGQPNAEEYLERKTIRDIRLR